MSDFETAFCKACNATTSIEWTNGFDLASACCARCGKAYLA